MPPARFMWNCLGEKATGHPYIQEICSFQASGLKTLNDTEVCDWPRLTCYLSKVGGP